MVHVGAFLKDPPPHFDGPPFLMNQSFNGQVKWARKLGNAKLLVLKFGQSPRNEPTCASIFRIAIFYTVNAD